MDGKSKEQNVEEVTRGERLSVENKKTGLATGTKKRTSDVVANVMHGSQKVDFTQGESVASGARFLQQMKAECHFFNGTERVWHVTRYIFNQEEILLFDSDVGEFRAVSELGQPIAEYLNSQKDILDNYRAAVDRCRNNYALVILMSQRRVKPKVTVYPTKTLPLQHHNLLVCAVSGFYPGHIEVRWFRNGQEEQSGVVSTGLIQNGDWTFQMLVMLETVPQSGEVYTCQVEHPSLTSPVTVEWSE
ncbi:HLA class II histocompatibility antigen, DRB1 beta chain [Ictidomys tridecemlineatus]